MEPLSKHYTENAPENSVELVVNVYNICYSEKNRYTEKKQDPKRIQHVHIICE